MLTGLTVEDMYVYYAIATVHAVATSESIRLIIDIPLKAADRYFELYQVHSLPFFHKEIGRYVMIDEAFTYLAVAESRQFFAVIPPYMLSRCTQDLYTVCPADMMLEIKGQKYLHSKALHNTWVRIPPGAWIFVCCECRVLSGRGLCDEMITRPETTNVIYIWSTHS